MEPGALKLCRDSGSQIFKPFLDGITAKSIQVVMK